MSDLEARVLEALEALPVDPSKRDALRHEAHALAMTAAFARLNDLPRGLPTRKRNGAKQEAEAMAEQAFTLFKLIYAAHGDTLAALKRHGLERHPFLIADDLKALMAATVAFLDEGTEQPAKIGRPSSRAAEMIADFAVHTFEQLTLAKASITVRSDREGNPAGGEFLTFLRDLYDAAGVRASAESHGKRAIQRARAGIEPGGKGGVVSIRHVPAKEKTTS